MPRARRLTGEDAARRHGLRRDRVASEPAAFGSSREVRRFRAIEAVTRALIEPDGTILAVADPKDPERPLAMAGVFRGARRTRRHLASIRGASVVAVHRGHGFGDLAIEVCIDHARPLVVVGRCVGLRSDPTMTSISFARRRAWSALAGSFAAMLLGCSRVEPTPVAVPGTQLAADYAAAVSILPEVTVEKGSPWSGLAIEDSTVVAQFSETSFSVAEIAAQLEQMTGTFETLRSLSGREDRFPDCVAPNGEVLDLGLSACRSARDAARFLRADAIRLFARGDAEQAAHRLAVGLGIVRQLARSDSVANLNAYGIFTYLVDPLPTMVDGAAGSSLDSAARTVLRDALDRLDPRAPFGPSLPADVAEPAVIEFEAAQRLLADP